MSEPVTPIVTPELPVKPPKPKRWRGILLVLVIFVSGMVLGSGLTVIVAVHRIRDRMHHPEKLPQEIAGRLERRLSLSPDQTTQVRAILTARQQHLMAIRQRVQPEVVGELDQAYSEIAAVLNENQRPRWETMYHELKAEWVPRLSNEPQPGSTDRQ
ncbi:MAG: hypothetical protein WCJ97_04100 [Phycisphaerae bacterium]